MLSSSRYIACFSILLIAVLSLSAAHIGGAQTPDATPAKAASAKPKSDWWSFKPATRPGLPANDSSLANPIDLFIRAKLAEMKLKASPEADATPLSGELKSLNAHARKHGLPSACRVLLNSTEFIFVD